MNEERANTHAQMIDGLYRMIIGTGECGKQALLELVGDNDPVVAGMAAVYSIRYDSKRCLSTLERVALEPGVARVPGSNGDRAMGERGMAGTRRVNVKRKR